LLTATQIKELAETHVDDTIDDSDALRWVNECTGLDLGTEAQFIKTSTVAVTDADTWYALPDDFLQFSYHNGIEDSDGYIWDSLPDVRKYVTVTAVTLAQTWAWKAKFPEVDTFTIYYHAAPTDITEMSQTPQTDPALHKAIALYVASRFKSMDDDENKDADRLMGEYRLTKREILQQLESSIPLRTIKDVYYGCS
jgi:hypothetical protein